MVLAWVQRQGRRASVCVDAFDAAGGGAGGRWSGQQRGWSDGSAGRSKRQSAASGGGDGQCVGRSGQQCGASRLAEHGGRHSGAAVGGGGCRLGPRVQTSAARVGRTAGALLLHRQVGADLAQRHVCDAHCCGCLRLCGMWLELLGVGSADCVCSQGRSWAALKWRCGSRSHLARTCTLWRCTDGAGGSTVRAAAGSR